MCADKFLDLKINEYVNRFGGAGCFFRRVIGSFDFDFSVISVKDFSVEISNKKEFVPGMKCYELYGKGHGKCENCLIDKAISKGKKVSFKNSVKESYFDPIFDGKGNVVSVISYDLKNREVIREVLKEAADKNEEIFYNILQNSHDFVYRYDFVENKFRYVSESVFTLLGFTLGEFVKMSYDDFLERVHPDDLFDINDYGACFGGEHCSNREYRWRCKDGEYRWFLDKRTVIFDDDGNRVSIMGDIRDITEDRIIRLQKEKLEARIARIKQRECEAGQRLTLTDKERLVLWGLCRYPLLNDEELSRELDIKRSTLTAIKNRMRGKGWFSLKYIPNFHNLGCEVLGFFDVSLGKGVAFKDFNFVKESSGVVFRNLQDNKAFGVFSSKAFVDFKKFGEDFCSKNKGVNFRDVGFFYKLEDFDMRDASGVVNFVFDLGMKGKSLSYGFDVSDNASEGGVDLNVNEKRVLHAMVSNPELSSAEIAKKIWVSKPTVIKIKKKLLDEGIVYAYVVPDFRKLGFNFVAKFVYEFDSEVPQDAKKNGDDARILFRVVGRRRIVKFVLFGSEEEYLEEVDLIKEAYRKSGIYFDFKSDVFPIQKRGKGNLDLEPFVDDLLFGNGV